VIPVVVREVPAPVLELLVSMGILSTPVQADIQPLLALLPVVNVKLAEATSAASANFQNNEDPPAL
jgi:hypothetical protein